MGKKGGNKRYIVMRDVWLDRRIPAGHIVDMPEKEAEELVASKALVPEGDVPQAETVPLAPQPREVDME